MLALTAKADLRCGTNGAVVVGVSRPWVTIDGVPVLVRGDLGPGKTIIGCMNGASAPCSVTTRVSGHSELVRIDGRALCVDRCRGMTIGADGGFSVKDPAQSWVEADA
jgi:hypothetical protein